MISLLILDNFYPVICRRVQRKRKATNYRVRFGHSLWSAQPVASAKGLSAFLFRRIVLRFYFVLHNYLSYDFILSYNYLSHDLILSYNYLSHDLILSYNYLSHDLILFYNYLSHDLILSCNYLSYDFTLSYLVTFEQKMYM